MFVSAELDVFVLLLLCACMCARQADFNKYSLELCYTATVIRPYENMVI